MVHPLSFHDHLRGALVRGEKHSDRQRSTVIDSYSANLTEQSRVVKMAFLGAGANANGCRRCIVVRFPIAQWCFGG
jgi:hypothetical protein